MAAELFEIRLSRKLLFILTVVGLVFFLAGLEIGFFHKVLGSEFGADKPIVKWIFVGIALFIGGAIFINCFFYLISPPVMLRVTRDKIWFGAGFRYNLFEMPAKLVDSIETYTQESNLEVDGKRAMVEGGTCIHFKNDPSIPNSKATSAGITYMGYNLRIFSGYANIGSREAVAAIKEILGKK
ncbi:MAG: hypothetical protein ACOYXC_10335 [Candidatus Rifleibacteriota bacterium]